MEQIKQSFEQVVNMGIEGWIDIAIALLIIAIAKMLSPMLTYGIFKMLNIKKKKSEIKNVSFYKPTKIFIFVLGIYLALVTLKLPEEVMFYITKAFKIIVIALVARGFANMAHTNSRTFKAIKDRLQLEDKGKSLKGVCRTIRAIIYIIAGFVIMSELGYDLNGLVAGLGIGSAVIALAAQDFAKSLIGGATILTDKLFEVGDCIEANGYTGTVEYVTFRSTRIRTFDNLEVTIPNGTLVNVPIINWSRMDKRRVHINLFLDFATSYNALKKLEEHIKSVLYNFPNVIKDSVNINYSEITPEGIDLYIYLFVDTIVYPEYLQIKGEINAAIIKTLEEENIKLGVAKNIRMKN